MIGFLGDVLDALSDGNVVVTVDLAGVSVRIVGHCGAILPIVIELMDDLLDNGTLTNNVVIV